MLVTAPNLDVYLSPKQVSDITGLSLISLKNLRLNGGGPVYSKVNERVIRYKKRDVFGWLDGCKRSNSSGEFDEVG